MTEYPLLNALIFTGLGIVVFALTVSAMAKAAPFDLRKQIVEERNVAAAIVAGALALGVAWIVASAMH